MENDSHEDISSGQRVPHLRTILIAIAVSFLSISHFLNEVSSWVLSEKFGNKYDYDITLEVLRRAQISYVAVGILSYVLFAFLFQRCRRKMCLYLVCASQLTASVLQLCTNSYWLLHVSRASSAVSDVGAAMFCVIYVSEIAPDEIRGALVAIHTLIYNLTSLHSAAMRLLQVNLIFKYCSWISLVVSVLVAILTYAAVPESPIYCLRKDDMAGAQKSLRLLHGNDKNVSRVITNRRKILKGTRSDSQTTTSVFRECFSRRSLKFTCMIIALYFTRNTVGHLEPHLRIVLNYWWINQWSHTQHFYFYIAIGFIQVVSNLLGILLCDRIGRKALLLTSTFVCSILLISTGIHIWDTDYDIHKKIGSLSIVFICVYSITFYLGLSILPEVLVSDMFPPKILSTQMAIFGSFQLCIDFAFFQSYFQYNSAKMHVQFCVYGVLSCVVALLMIKFLQETKCRPPGYKYIDSEERVLLSSMGDGEE